MEVTLVISWRRTDSPPPVTEESTVLVNAIQSQQAKEYALAKIQTTNEIQFSQVSSCINKERI
jgi:hypothetical protein